MNSSSAAIAKVFSSQKKAEGIHFIELWNLIRRKKFVIFNTVFLCCAAMMVYLWQVIPQYQAQTSILLDDKQSNLMQSIASMTAGLNHQEADINSEIEIIRSTNLLASVVDKNGLYYDKELRPQAGFFQNLMAGITGKTNHIKYSKAQLKNGIIQALNSRLSVERKGQTQVIIIGYRSNDPQKAQKIVTAVANAYLVDQLEARLQATQRATGWLEERLTGLRQELRQKENSVIAYKQQHNLLSAQGATQIEQQVSRLNEELIIAKGATAEKLAIYNQVRRLAQSDAIQSFSGVLNSGVITSLRGKEAEISREIANLSARYGENHPTLRNAKKQLTDINGQIRSEVSRILAGAQSEYEIARSREASLQSSVQGLRAEFKVTGGHAARLQQLENEASIAKNALDSVSERFRNSDKTEEVQQNKARIISAATIPGMPIFPKKTMMMGMAFLFGIILGGVIVVISEQSAVGFVRAKDVEERLGLSVISQVPLLNFKKIKKETGAEKLYTYLQKKPISMFSEAIRKIRVATEVDHINGGVGQVVLVTSSLMNEGKTNISASYASSWAHNGRKVLLVDCDFRNPSLAKLFGIETGQGLNEFLSGDAPLESVIQKNIMPNVDFIGIKNIPNSPSDSFSLPSFVAALEKLKQEYPLIILDTPPLAPVIDTAVIANVVDNIVYVTAWETTPAAIVESCLKSLHHNQDKIVGIVLNKLNIQRESYYGYEQGGYGLKEYAAYYNS